MNSIKQIIDKEIEAIRAIPLDGSMEKAVELIGHAVHEQKGKIVTSGMGKAGQIAQNIASTFSSTGSPAVFIHPSEAQHGDLGLLQKNDILFLISNSGKTREILEFIELSRALNPDIKIIGLTGNTNSPLAQAAEVVISTGNPAEVCPLGLVPTTSTTCMSIVGDVLVVALMQKINFTKAEFAKRHHSGYLGKKARS